MRCSRNKTALSFRIVLCCLFRRSRNSFNFPLLALLEFPVALVMLQVSTQERFRSPLSHTFHILQENRQFGSKMTDSKYFTTTKKGRIAQRLCQRSENKPQLLQVALFLFYFSVNHCQSCPSWVVFWYAIACSHLFLSLNIRIFSDRSL